MPTSFFKRLGWFWWGVIVLALALLGVGAFFGVQYLTAASLGSVSPEDGSVVATSQVVITAEIPGYSPEDDQLVLEIDGIPCAPEDMTVTPPTVSTTRRLEDGRHTVSVIYTSDNVFARRLARHWAISVDTTAPTIKVVSPAPPERIPSTPHLFRVLLDEPGRVQVLVDGVPAELDAGVDSAEGLLNLPEGERIIRVEATDAVGNTSSKEWRTFADYQAPVLEMETTVKNPLDDIGASVRFAVKDNLPQGLAVTALVDGRRVAVRDLAAVQGSTDPSVRRYAISTGELSEGTHVMEIEVRDAATHTHSYTQEFLVDSTAEFGRRPMSEGAIGADVNQLQSVLASKGFLEGSPTGVYDATTTAAVTAYQTDRGLTASGRVDEATVRSLVGYILIDRSDCTLTLYDDKGVVKTYGVAVGMAEYPTPLGNFSIVVKTRNPTWSPPPSPWAEHLEPVPPGPDNPLGTRWMGLSAPYVGIHGTPNDWSIGGWYSHGCIRMHIPDAEDLFERVYVGTPVDIVR